MEAGLGRKVLLRDRRRAGSWWPLGSPDHSTPAGAGGLWPWPPQVIGRRAPAEPRSLHCVAQWLLPAGYPRCSRQPEQEKESRLGPFPSLLDFRTETGRTISQSESKISGYAGPGASGLGTRLSRERLWCGLGALGVECPEGQ